MSASFSGAMAVKPAGARWLEHVSSSRSFPRRPAHVGPMAGTRPGTTRPSSRVALGSTGRMSPTLAARIVAVGGVSTPDRSSPRMFASARDDAVRARLVRANHHRAARVPPRGITIVAAALPRDDDDERREISRRRPDGRRDWSGLGSINDHTLPGNLRKIQNAKNEARDSVAATAVMYAFAAWQYLQWPASIPHASLVPAPHIAALVAAAATGLVVPVLAAAAHPGARK